MVDRKRQWERVRELLRKHGVMLPADADPYEPDKMPQFFGQLATAWRAKANADRDDETADDGRLVALDRMSLSPAERAKAERVVALENALARSQGRLARISQAAADAQVDQFFAMTGRR